MTEKIMDQDSALEPIWEAAKEGHWDTVKECLQRDPSLVNATCVVGRGVGYARRLSVLHIAVKFQRRDPDMSILEYLVSNGAHVNTQFVNEQFKVSNCEDEKNRTKNPIFLTPLLHFALECYANVEVFEFLVSHGADVNAKDKDGNTVLHLLVDRQYERHNTERTAEIFEYLLSVGADINARGNKGNTPLHIAYHYNADKMLKYLISKGADVYAKNDNDMSLQDELDDIEGQIGELEEDLVELEARRDMLCEAMGARITLTLNSKEGSER